MVHMLVVQPEMSLSTVYRVQSVACSIKTTLLTLSLMRKTFLISLQSQVVFLPIKLLSISLLDGNIWSKTFGLYF